MENSERDGNSRPPDLPLEKFVWRSGRKVRTGHGTTDWFQIRKGERQGYNAGLDEAQAEIKTAWRNINKLRYADDTTLMAESEEELKSLLMKMKKKSEKVVKSSTFIKLRSWHLVPSLHAK